MLVELREQDGIAEIVLNDPGTRNAITGPMGEQLAQHVRAANANASVRVIVLRGAGGAFCSGLNLKQFNADPRPAWLADFQTIWRNVHRSLFESQKPILTALEKYAINGGAALALASDLLLVGDDSFLQIGEVRQGMAAPYNIAWLRLQYSESVISQLALTGRRFNGDELFRLGVAYEAPSTTDVVTRTRELAAELSGYPDEALSRIKALVRVGSQTADEWFDQFRVEGGRRGPIPKVE